MEIKTQAEGRKKTIRFLGVIIAECNSGKTALIMCPPELQGKNNTITETRSPLYKSFSFLETYYATISKLHILQGDKIVEINSLKQMHVYHTNLAPKEL